MRRIPFEIILAVLVLVANLYAVILPPNSLVMGWFGSDDAFYYFKTAQNITEGRGITFDGLGRDSGFHPLWMLVITPIFALARYDRILPLRLVVVLSALLHAGTAVLLYRLAKRFFVPLAAAFVALFWGFYPFVHSQVTEMGMESGISAFFIALLIYRIAKADDAGPGDGRVNLPNLLLTGAVAALTVLARLDNIFLVLLCGLWLAFRPQRVRILLLSDITLISLGVLWSYMERVGFGPQYAQSAVSSYFMIVAALAVRIPLYYLFGLYQRPAAGLKGLLVQLGKAAGASLLATLLTGAVMLGLQAIHLFAGFPRLVLFYEAGFGLAALLATRLIAVPFSRADRPEEPILWKATFLRLAGYYLPIGLVLMVYMGWNQWYFGTPMPVSGQVKRWWGTLPNPIYGEPAASLREMLGLFNQGGPWGLIRDLFSRPAALPEGLRMLVYGGVALVILISQWKRTQKAIQALALFPLFAGCIVQLISYTGTGYLHMRNWYWVSDILAITLLVGIAADDILCWAQERVQKTTVAKPPATVAPQPVTAAKPQIGRPPARLRIRYNEAQLASGLVIGLALLSIGYGIEEMVRRMPMYVRPARAEFYLESIRELEARTEPGSVIGSTGGGTIAYFINDRTVVNLDGLMNTSEYFHLLQQGKASQYLDRIGMDYLYTSSYPITSSDPYFQFKGRFTKILDFGGSTLFYWK